MFVAQAHSFSQQARLAITLAWIAGYTNIITILTCGEVTSHATGTASNLGRDIAAGEWHLAGYFLFLLLAFLAGAVLSGLLTETGRRRAWDSIYVLPMVAEALLLAAFALGEQLALDQPQQGPGIDPAPISAAARWYLTGLAAAAMGVQNATITRISGGVVRTTHVTGTLTDLGLEAAHLVLGLWDRAMRRGTGPRPARPADPASAASPRRILLLLSLIGSFCLGAGLGTRGYALFPAQAMFPPVLFLLWIIYQDLRTPIAEVAPSPTHPLPEPLPPGLALFRIQPRPGGRLGVQRFPNLLSWAQRLDPATRVVILDVASVADWHANAALELQTALTHLHAAGRRLLVTGLDAPRQAQLRAAGHLPADALCPSVDAAIASGLAILQRRGQ